jgi:hypothetical protein
VWLSLLLKALANVYGDILMVLMTVKRTFVTRKNKMRSECATMVSNLPDNIIRTLDGFLIALYVLNPFRRPFDAVISRFNQRHIFLKDTATHADRRERHREKDQKKLDKFLKSLNYVDVAPKHAASQEAIHHDENPGDWLLQSDQYKARSTVETSGPSGLLWVSGKRKLPCYASRFIVI